MITKETLKIFERYRGDHDMWSRIGNARAAKGMNSPDWNLIDSLIQHIQIVNRGLAHEQFRNKLEAQLQKACDSEKTITMLKSFSFM